MKSNFTIKWWYPLRTGEDQAVWSYQEDGVISISNGSDAGLINFIKVEGKGSITEQVKHTQESTFLKLSDKTNKIMSLGFRTRTSTTAPKIYFARMQRKLDVLGGHSI